MQHGVDRLSGMDNAPIGSRPLYEGKVRLLSKSLRSVARQFLLEKRKGEPKSGLADVMKATADSLIDWELRLDAALMREDLALEGILSDKGAVLDTYLSTNVNDTMTRLTPNGLKDLIFAHHRMRLTGEFGK